MEDVDRDYYDSVISLAGEELDNYRKAWENESPVTLSKASQRNGDILIAENKLRDVLGYPTTNQAGRNIESWDNEETGAYVSGDAFVIKNFSEYIISKKVNVAELSDEDLIDYFSDWEVNNCFLMLSGDLWGRMDDIVNFYGEDVIMLPWDEYDDNYYPEWIKEDSEY